MRIALTNLLFPRAACTDFSPFSIRAITARIALMRSRCALATLSDAQLRDVGLSRTQAEQEAARPIWDAPAAWKR